MFVQKPNYKTSMRKIASVQSKIEGWEVSVRINNVHTYCAAICILLDMNDSALCSVY